jgi:hypothetical protein
MAIYHIEIASHSLAMTSINSIGLNAIWYKELVAEKISQYIKVSVLEGGLEGGYEPKGLDGERMRLVESQSNAWVPEHNLAL